MGNDDQVDREEVFVDYCTALARLVTVALSALKPDAQAVIASEIEQRNATIQIMSSMDPVNVVGSLRPVDRSKPPIVLFRIGMGLPSTTEH